jgi:phosphatidylglycerophosphate synthase
MVLTWDGYCTRWAGLHGGVDPRSASRFVRGWLRLGYAVARPLAVAGLPPAAVTVAGLVLCALVPVAAAAGLAPAGALLVLVAAVADTADGAVAVLGGRVSRLGYLYDSVADRLGEACWLAALWLLGVPGGLVLATGLLVFLHEYVRARAVAAGMAEVGAVTVAERPTRVIVMVVALVWVAVAGAVAPAGTVAAGPLELSGPGAAGAAVATLVWLLLALVGLAQLLRAAHRVLAHRTPD